MEHHFIQNSRVLNGSKSNFNGAILDAYKNS